jgi:hypothetical protein
MQASQVHDYASRLLREHGDKAQLIVAGSANIAVGSCRPVNP